MFVLNVAYGWNLCRYTSTLYAVTDKQYIIQIHFIPNPSPSCTMVAASLLLRVPFNIRYRKNIVASILQRISNHIHKWARKDAPITSGQYHAKTLLNKNSGQQAQFSGFGVETQLKYVFWLIMPFHLHNPSLEVSEWNNNGNMFSNSVYPSNLSHYFDSH